MSQEKFTEDKYLYWAKPSDFIAGRDALGIQNSSAVIYATLLPGITNLTRRMRYYGFFCWLLNAYDGLELPKDSLKQQYTFIRRAELMIAFYMQANHPDFGDVPGKLFAADFGSRFQDDGRIDIASGADKGSFLTDDKGVSRSYWKYTSGAFGQYYSGAMLTLKLIRQTDKVYFLNDKGVTLANAFETSLPPSAKENLLHLIDKGILDQDEMPFLAPFDMSIIKPQSEEWKSYIDLLFDKDSEQGSTFFRKNTLLNFLDLRSKGVEYSDQILGKYYFQNPLEIDLKSDSTRFGWFFYYAHELVHYSMEYCFNTMLQLMKNDLYSIDEFIDEQRDILKIYLDENRVEVTLGDLIQQSKNNETVETIYTLLASFKGLFSEGSIGELYFTQLKIISFVIEYMKPNLPLGQRFLSENGIFGKRGNLIEINTYFRKNEDRLLPEFFGDYLIKILNDHQVVAYNKLGNGTAQVHKFLIEHNHLIPVNTIEPRMTGPRLGSVNNILKDLQLLEPQTGEITELGKKILQQNPDFS